jgi:hypothetical protein
VIRVGVGWPVEHEAHDCKLERCFICEGGLFECVVCHSFEGATTTHCPGRRLTQQEMDAVYEGSLNFRDGAWHQEPSGSCSSHYLKPTD